MNITAEKVILTPTGPAAFIDGVWYSVNGTSTEVYEIRYALRPSEVESLTERLIDESTARWEAATHP